MILKNCILLDDAVLNWIVYTDTIIYLLAVYCTMMHQLINVL
jgi:hypothetical protein